MPILSAKRQVTLPKELCDRLRVRPGDQVEFLEHNGRITILKKARGASAAVLRHLKADARYSDEESLRDALARKHHRQQALLRVVSQQRLSTQADVVRALRRAGFAATQATVSRDVVELGLVKVARDGTHAYAPPSAAAPGGGMERLRRFCEDYPVEGALATNLVVLRSLPGTANALAAALDASRLDEAVGTLAGDDTVFIAATNERHARALLGRLTTFGIARKGTK